MKYRIRDQRFLCLVFLALAWVGGASQGCHLISHDDPPQASSTEVAPDFRLMTEAWETIQKVYVDRAAIKPKLMTYGAIGGMVDSLGDTGHSHFLTPEMLQQERNFTKGKLEGIGAEVRMRNNQVVVVAPIDGSPAEKAGLKPGDIILKVNGEETVGLPLSQVVGKILGPTGTQVKLTVLKPRTDHAVDVTIIRASITLHGVSWQRLPGTTVAHLRIMAFSQGVSKELRRALIAIGEERLSGLILDLRNNPGGLFDEAVNAASEFLPSGNVLLEKDAAGKTTPVPVRSGGVATRLPMEVLINAGTSSGAEIVAGALQDAHRGTLVGEKTFGTGTVLSSFPLSDGSALMLAIKEWLTPSGHVIWHRGVSPDVTVPLLADVMLLRPDTEKEMSPDQLRTSEDLQLLRALELLSEPMQKKALR